MPLLQTFSLPLPSNGPPEGFGFVEREPSELSTTTAFDTGIDCRDTWGGRHRCVVCGSMLALQHCHIIPQCSRETVTWAALKTNKYIPGAAKSARHEPRNGMLMCKSHHALFDQLFFFIRYIPTTRQFVFVNYCSQFDPMLIPYHGKSILMNMDDRYAPFPALFLIHEQRVRGFWPFSQPPDIPISIPRQDWLLSETQSLPPCSGLVSDNARPSHATVANNALGQPAPDMGRPAPGSMTLTLDDDIVSQILHATRNSESWKACVQEGTSWEGTAEENIAKYTQEVMP